MADWSSLGSLRPRESTVERHHVDVAVFLLAEPVPELAGLEPGWPGDGRLLSLLQRLQQWQAQHAPPAVLPSPAHCDHSEKLHELEKNLTQALVEQTCQQKQHQRELMAQFVSPIKKSVEDIKEKLETSTGDLKQQRTSLAEVADDVKGVAASVTDLHQQVHNSCEETCKAVTTEAAAIKAALTELRARVDAVEGSVNSCSEKVCRVLEGDESKHEALLSAVAASSCNCPQNGSPEVKSTEDASDPGLTSRKRRRIPDRYGAAERNPARDTSSPSVDGSPPRSATRSSSRYEINTSVWQEGETDPSGLHHALDRIQALRSKRRSGHYIR
ncbi:hypothetical protein ON010_g18287 [Phytophthora cinnamomi]|nr:hypothetical protein ON010_g18287 [Phytophthora cinnamomi]